MPTLGQKLLILAGGSSVLPRYLEVGLVDAYTVVVVFNTAIYASNYATGVVIKKNTVSQTIDSATLQADNRTVYFVLHVEVAAGDAVTWEYDAGTGDYTNQAGNRTMKNVAAKAVVNNLGGMAGYAMGVLGLTYSS